ncbi:MAG: DNA alkylation repair protein, partial [Eubacteriales bacterium]
MNDISAQVKEQLFLMRDDTYKTFQASLIPTVSPSRIIGVRVPLLHRLAKEMTQNGSGALYLRTACLPHTYYDEDNLH